MYLIFLGLHLLTARSLGARCRIAIVQVAIPLHAAEPRVQPETRRRGWSERRCSLEVGGVLLIPPDHRPSVPDWLYQWFNFAGVQRRGGTAGTFPQIVQERPFARGSIPSLTLISTG